MNRNVIAIVTAAGSGTRFSKDSKKETPKQFVRLFNKTVILFPLLAMQKCKAISGIFITSAPEYFDFIHKLAVKNKITKLAGLVEGGKTRFDSVKNAFGQIDRAGSPLVMIHDAARPNISMVLIEEIINAANKYGEVIFGSRLLETIKREKNGYISETLNRENLWAIQTPQVFRYKILKDSYNKTRKSDFTDEASLVESAGYSVKIIEGTRGNIKITTPEDLEFLKKIMK